ncbi:UNVERIFIED_CONTAM: hypothetical protein Sradi_6179300 [Sesamum radiatum]|uniref:Ty1-copia retrotransposon protein n=1 Tax=Sesamum radiatum TaxID=300843 RepID=A0AAW2KA72_SESRA
MVVPMPRTLPDFSKLEQLDGTNFKRWSQKLLIFFEQLEVDYVLFTDPPEIPVQTTDASTAIMTASQTEPDRSKRDDELKLTIKVQRPFGALWSLDMEVMMQVKRNTFLESVYSSRSWMANQ